MEYIDALNEVKENHINILNDYIKNYSEYDNKFQKDNYDLDKEYTIMTDLMSEMRHDMVNTDVALIGTAMCIYFDELINLLIAFMPISVYSLVNFIKDVKEYIKNYYNVCDLEDNIEIYKLNSTIIIKKKRIIEKEIDKLNIALEFFKSLSDEDKEKYLSLNINKN